MIYDTSDTANHYTGKTVRIYDGSTGSWVDEAVYVDTEKGMAEVLMRDESGALQVDMKTGMFRRKRVRGAFTIFVIDD